MSRKKMIVAKKKAPVKGAPPKVAPMPWDLGARGPANRAGLVVEERGERDPETGKTRNPNRRIGVRRESWVDRYERKELLSVSQANAARHLRSLAEGHVSQDPLAALRVDRNGDRSDPAAAAFDARRAYHRAWAMVPRHARPIVERVVIEDRPIRSLARNGNQQARALGYLRLALDVLALHVASGGSE